MRQSKEKDPVTPGEIHNLRDDILREQQEILSKARQATESAGKEEREEKEQNQPFKFFA